MFANVYKKARELWFMGGQEQSVAVPLCNRAFCTTSSIVRQFTLFRFYIQLHTIDLFPEPDITTVKSSRIFIKRQWKMISVPEEQLVTHSSSVILGEPSNLAPWKMKEGFP
jgi:hypothetical protein